jgi:hypothetical protein
MPIYSVEDLEEDYCYRIISGTLTRKVSYLTITSAYGCLDGDTNRGEHQHICGSDFIEAERISDECFRNAPHRTIFAIDDIYEWREYEYDVVPSNMIERVSYEKKEWSGEFVTAAP